MTSIRLDWTPAQLGLPANSHLPENSIGCPAIRSMTRISGQAQRSLNPCGPARGQRG